MLRMNPPSEAGPRPPLRRLGIGGRVGLAIGVVAALLLGLGALVTFHVAQLHAGLRRMQEEHRETGFTRDLLQFGTDLSQRLPGQAAADARLDAQQSAQIAGLLAGAREVLHTLERGPRGDDPSSAEHQGEEHQLFARIESGLDELEQLTRPQAALAPAARRTAPLVQELAELDAETRAEAHAAGVEMRERARAMRSEVLWTTAASLLVLVGVVWFLRVSVVRPVQELRRAVQATARGDLSRRVPEGGADEIGELTREFNRMAGELHGMRSGLEQRVEERTQEFLRAARLAGLGTLAAGVAHEINNPLASIASCAEGLERRLSQGGASLAEQREYLQIIAKEAYRAHEITTRLLELARAPDATDLPYSLPELLRELEVLLAHRLQAKGLALHCVCEQGLPALRGNPAECKQVLLNLVHNAIDASPRGATIEVRCRRQADSVVMEVEDRGPGIPAEHLERVFDPFFTTKAPGEGTGLGLAIAHRIVEDHGGRLEATNTGRGALLRVSLPLARYEVAR